MYVLWDGKTSNRPLMFEQMPFLLVGTVTSTHVECVVLLSLK
jgi:hypothetical protein